MIAAALFVLGLLVGFAAGFAFTCRCLRLGLGAHVSGRRRSPAADRLAAILTAAAARNERAADPEVRP